MPPSDSNPGPWNLAGSVALAAAMAYSAHKLGKHIEDAAPTVGTQALTPLVKPAESLAASAATLADAAKSRSF